MTRLVRGRRAALAAMMITVLMLGSCVGGDGGESTESTGNDGGSSVTKSGDNGPIDSDPCSLLTAAEVKAAIGVDATPKLSKDDPLGSSCAWRATTSPDHIEVVLIAKDLCSLDRDLQAAGTEGHIDIAQSGSIHGGTLDVITKRGCFSVLGADTQSNPLPQDVVVTAAKAVLAKL